MRLIYFGDGPWAHASLHRIVAAGFEVLRVVTRFPKGDQVLAKIAADYGIEVVCVADVNSDRSLVELKADLGVSMSFDQIFRANFLRTFPAGIVNCHAGKLPFYRGRNILNWALINDENEIGVTCHYVNEKVDTGDIIVQRCFPVSDEDDYGTVLSLATSLCPDVLLEALEQLRDGTARPVAQPVLGSYFIARREGDEWLDWKAASREVFNFVRALTSPGPCARTCLLEEGRQLMLRKVLLPAESLSYKCIEGAVIGIDESGRPLVKTGDSWIVLADYEFLDREGRVKLRVGDRLGCLSSRALVVPGPRA